MITDAVERPYAAVAKLHFPGMQFRHAIARGV
jgi:hypothetical protein